MSARTSGPFLSVVVSVLRTLWYVGLLVVGLVVLPWPLYRLSNLVLDAIDYRDAIANPLSPPVAILGAVSLGWTMWVWLLYATVVDVIHAARQAGGSARARLPVPLHTAVSSAAGSLMMLINTVVGSIEHPSTAHAAVGQTPATSDEPPRTTPTAIPAASSNALRPAALTVTVSAGPGSKATPAATYIVRRGDTLSSIAGRQLRDSSRWREICTLNWHRHWPQTGGTLRDCDLIYPGWELNLPSAATAPADPSAGSPATAVPSPATPHTAAVPNDLDGIINQPTSPSPAPTHSQENRAASAGQSSPAASAPAAAPAHDERRGVQLPGGSFVPWSLAVAVTAAAGLVWLQRRRRFRLDHDPVEAADLAPLPPVVRQLRRHVARYQPAPVPHKATEVVAEDNRGPAGLPAGGIGLVGDGAQSAARALLVATLAAGGPQHPDQRGEAVMPAAAYTTLLSIDAADQRPWPRLHIAANLDEALTLIDAKVLNRARLHNQHALAHADGEDPYAPDEEEEALPPILLVAETPSSHGQARLRTSLELSDGLGVCAALLGPWPHGATVEIDHEGHTRTVHGSPEPAINDRLGVLSAANARAILDTLREAQTGEPANAPDAKATQPQPQPPTDPAPPLPDDTEPHPATAAQQPAHDRPDAQPEQLTTARLQVLGPPRIDNVTRPGRPLRSKAAELAVFLACHPDGADTATIADQLLPDARLRAANQQVHTNASNLRHVLARSGGPRPRGYLLKHGATARYRLDPTTVDVDLWHLRDLLARAQLAAGTTRTDLLHQACTLYTAPLADGCDYEWVEPHREAARRWGIEAHLLLADELLATDPHAAAELLTKAISLDRYNEDLYRKAMHARHALRDSDGIQALLNALTKALADIDAQPVDTTVELAAQLRASLDQP